MIYRFIEKMGTFKSSVLATVLSILLSLTITSLSIVIFKRDHAMISLIISAIIPLFIAPVFSYSFIRLINEISKSNRELQIALNDVKELSGLLPICASCKKVRDDKGYWNQIEQYISDKTDAKFSHGVCPDCYKKIMDEE